MRGKNLYTGKTYNSVENVAQFFKDRGLNPPARTPLSRPPERPPVQRQPIERQPSRTNALG